MLSYKTFSLAVLASIAVADGESGIPADIQNVLDNHNSDFGLISPAPMPDDLPDNGLISPAPGDDDLPDKLCSDGEEGCGGTPEEFRDDDEDEKFLDDVVEQNGAVAGVHAIAALCVSSAALAALI